MIEYQRSLEAENKSPKTISWYFEILSRYFECLKSSHLLKPIDKLDKQELRSYVKHLQESPRWPNQTYIKKEKGKLSPYSIKGHVAAIKAFWSWLFSEGYIEVNPLEKFPLPMVPKNLIRIVTPQQFENLLAFIDESTPVGAKYYTVLCIFYDSGPRLAEVCNMRMDDIDFQHNDIRVIGKGRKERRIPISTEASKQIRTYMNKFRPKLCPVQSPYLFADKNGKPISTNSVQKFFGRLAEQSTIQGTKFSPHILRHSFATQALANGANVFYIKEIMGHESLQTTLKYTHIQHEDLQNQHAKFSPLANLNIKRSPKRRQ